MPFPLIAAGIAASAAGAAGNIAGGAMANETPSVGSMLTTDYDPTADPVLNALSIQALGGTGGLMPHMLMEASPMRRALAELQASPYIKNENKREAARTLQEALEKGLSVGQTLEKRGSTGLDQIFGADALDDQFMNQWRAIGIDPRRVLRQELKWRDKMKERYGPLLESQDQIAADRAGGFSRLAELSNAFPTATAAEQRKFEAIIRDREMDRIGDVERVGLQNAAFTGANPAQMMSDMANRRADADVNSAIQASQILSMRQAIAQGAIQGIAAALSGPTSSLQGATSTRMNANVGAAGIAGQQALSATQARNQAQVQGAQSLGSGVAAGFQAPMTALMLSQVLGGGQQQSVAPGVDPGYDPVREGAMERSSRFSWHG